MDGVRQHFLKLSENIISRTMHDIISPLTAIMNGTSILTSRESKDKQIIESPITNSTVLGFIDGGVQQILNQINLTKYLYTIGREEFLISISELFENLNMILKKYNSKISFDKKLTEIWSYEIQLIFHVIFILIDNLNQESDFNVKKKQDKIYILQSKNSEIILDKIFNCESKISPLNINIHFFKFLLKELNYEIKSQFKQIIIQKTQS